jgi:hypothetical protein
MRKMFAHSISMISPAATMKCGKCGSKKSPTTSGSPQSNGSQKTTWPWDLALGLDGSVESLPVPEIEGESRAISGSLSYPAPPVLIPYHNRIKQLARDGSHSPLYSARSLPARSHSKGSAVTKYSSVIAMPNFQTMFAPFLSSFATLSFWSVEFANTGTRHALSRPQLSIMATVNPPRSTFARAAAGACTYVKAHPYPFAAPSHWCSPRYHGSSCSGNSHRGRPRCARSDRWQRSGRMVFICEYL